jgi:hypothetical protein
VQRELKTLVDDQKQQKASIDRSTEDYNMMKQLFEHLQQSVSDLKP